VTSAPRRRRYYFRRIRLLVFGVVFVVVGGGLGANIIVQTVKAHVWGIVALGAVIVLMSLVFGYRTLRLVVVVRSSGVKVCNMWRTRKLAFSEIDRVSPASANVSGYVLIYLTDGSAVTCDVFSPSAIDGIRGLDRLAARLQAAIDEYKPRVEAQPDAA
jgi:hypothetical protein